MSALALVNISLAASEKAPFMTNVYGRNDVVSLNGKWEAIIDLYDLGMMADNKMVASNASFMSIRGMEVCVSMFLVTGIPRGLNSRTGRIHGVRTIRQSFLRIIWKCSKISRILQE